MKLGLSWSLHQRLRFRGQAGRVVSKLRFVGVRRALADFCTTVAANCHLLRPQTSGGEMFLATKEWWLLENVEFPLNT